ncbi:MAG: hypothetical protein HY985_02880 [Magnetospirillum sp.]|nr:hypothetical protein [Magnetospirillum sp.]
MSVPTKEDIDATADGILDNSYCTAPEHFFSPAARDLIGRYMPSFLDQLILTPTELVHSAKAQKRLHDAGRVLMNVVDKVGTLQARFKSVSPAKRVKELHTLVSAASKKVWDDERERPLPSIQPETFAGALMALKGTDAEKDYQANRMLTEYLSQFKVWKEKVEVLVRMVNLYKGKDAFRYVEPVLGECLKSDPALDQLLGMAERLETRCNDLVDLWKGTWEPREGTQPTVKDINALIAEDLVPSVKAGIEYALMRALAGKVPLRSAEPEPEIQAVFDLCRRMWLGQGLLGGAKGLAMLEKRQTRHLNTEGVTDLLRERKVLADRLLYLFNLCTLAIGPSNRATLKAFIDHYFGDRDFVLRVAAGQEAPVPKMQTFTQLHRAIRASWLTDEEKANYCGLIEGTQGELLKRSRLFEQIDKKGGGPSQKVLTLLDLCRKNTFIEGPNLETVRQAIQSYLRDPMFLQEYIGGVQGEERDRKMSLLTKMLNSVGINTIG